jgi:hypothetical protein
MIYLHKSHRPTDKQIVVIDTDDVRKVETWHDHAQPMETICVTVTYWDGDVDRLWCNTWAEQEQIYNGLQASIVKKYESEAAQAAGSE